MSARAARNSLASDTRVTSRKLMARSCTLPRKLIAYRCFTLFTSLTVARSALIVLTLLMLINARPTNNTSTPAKPRVSRELIVMFRMGTTGVS